VTGGAAGRGRPVTIADVARHAGVSASTVSYVLSGKRTISESTRARVLASVRALGFHPHAGARALASNRAGLIALALPQGTGPHLPVVAAVLAAARSAGHDVLLTADEGAGGLRRIAAGAMADGVILMTVETWDARVPALRDLGRPSVLIGLPAGAAGLTCVDLDFERAGALCVEHLAGLGHRRIVLLGPPPVVYRRDIGYARRARDGFRAAAARCGVEAVSRPVEPVYPATLAAVDEHENATALIVHNEGAVDHVLTALRALGRRVPQDVSVLAICPDEVAVAATPPLSNVRIPAHEVGELAVRLLLDRLAGTGVPETTLLPPILTDRRSTDRPHVQK
jgi:DNA-binding LacI/PurR family transcriptional regulator